MSVETMPFDEAKYLADAESQRFLLNDAIESGDSRYIGYALRVVSRARGKNQHLSESSATCEALGEDGDLRLSTLTSVLSALNFKLSIDIGTNSATE